MKERRSQSSPFGKVLYFGDGEIEELCESALAAAGCLPDNPEPIEIESFIERFLGAQITYEDLDDGVLGFAMFDGRGGTCVVGAARALFDGGNSGSRRARSTLAHEAGHGILHGQVFVGADRSQSLLDGNYEPQARRILCREQDFRARGYGGRWWEWQANQAIGGFLIPRGLLEQSVRPLLTTAGTLGVPTLPKGNRDAAIRVVAATFDVNPVVAEIRLAGAFDDSAGQMLL